jgi:hypothetical protein
MIKGVIIAIFAIFIIVIIGSCATMCNRVVSDTKETVYKEVSPQALLKKYEWFKNASAELDKKKADIDVFAARKASIAETYGKDATKWPRDVRETLAQSSTELAGIKSSFNSLAAEYNAQMAKINWRFCNIGDLPEGATVALPRDYKTYVSE